VRVWAPMKRLALACLFVLGILPNALALQVIEPEGDRGPFFINFRYPHLFFSFYIDTPAEISLDFEAGQRGGIEPSTFLCFLNSHYTLGFSLQEGQRSGRYRLYLGPVLRGRHSVRIDLVQPKKERKTPEAVLDRVRFLGAEPGDEHFSVLRHTPLYILETPEQEATLFGRFWYKETDQGLELTYGLTTTCASEGQELVRALETTGLPFRQLETLSARISPFGLILGLDFYQNGRLAPFQGRLEGTHPLLSLNLASGKLKEAKALPKEGVYRVDPTRYGSLKDVTFLRIFLGCLRSPTESQNDRVSWRARRIHPARPQPICPFISFSVPLGRKHGQWAIWVRGGTGRRNTPKDKGGYGKPRPRRRVRVCRKEPKALG